MVATTAEPCRPKTFDIAGGDLVLQICGNSRHGQIVRLKAPKCTIGSAANCTLRLRARGVAPLHCLILRGPGGAVVRRWSPDTLLNHQAFTDAALSPSDRLSVGPVELEVLSSGSGANWVAPAPAVERLPLPQLPDLEVQAEREQLESQRAAVELQRQQWQTERTEAEQGLATRSEELDARHAELDARATALEAQRAALDEDRRHWESECGERMAAAAAQLEQLKPQTAELAAQRKALDEERRHWESERDECMAAAEAQLEQLKPQTAELAAQRKALDEERRHWESECGERMAAAAAQLKQLKPQTAELDAQRKALEEDCLRWQAERAEAERLLQEQNEELNNRLTALNAQLAELEATRAALDEERRRWEAERDEGMAAAAAQLEQLMPQTAELDAQRKALEEDRLQWQAERAEAERLSHEQNEELNNRLTALNARIAELDARAAELNVHRQAFDLEQQQWQTDRAKLQRRLNERDGALTVRLADLDARSADLDARTAELATRQATLDADRALFHEDRSRWQQQQEQAAAPRPAAAAVLDDEEESVDDYMSRLMDRIRSSAGDSGPSTYTPPKSEPRRPAGSQPAAAEVARPRIIAQAQTPIEQREPVQMSPRTVAPESRVNFSALRELANLSARADIDRHARQTLIRTIYSKLAVAVVAFLSGAVLLWMWNSIQTGNQTFYSSLAALLIAIFWVLEYAILTGRLFVSNSGHIGWNSSRRRERPLLAAKDNATEKASPADAGPSDAVDTAAAVVDSASHKAAGR
jgi:hypothetical protein